MVVEPSSTATGVSLRQRLLEIASALPSDSAPTVVREWTDPVLLHDPEPVGYRSFVLVAVGGEDWLDFDDVVEAFQSRDWKAYRWGGGPGGWATAKYEGCEVRVYQGTGAGLVMLTGWMPVVFIDQDLRQPRSTRSLGAGVLCAECNGWGACLDCEGTGRANNPKTWGRCWCVGGRGGPGSCIGCGGNGRIDSEAPSWKRESYAIPDPDGPDTFRRPPPEDGHATLISALIDVAHRPCACGDVVCHWRYALDAADDHLALTFTGSCQGCAANRAHAFRLPYRELADPPPPPAPPPCPLCGAAPIPLVGGLHFPGSPMMRAQELGLVAPRGSLVTPDDPNWRCASCGHDWRDGDERRRAAILRAILDEVPGS